MFSALIIDADGKTPATLKAILAPYGFEFTVTENGPEAVNVARQAAPDLILLRAELPLTTGFSVCNRLRRNEDTKKIPLIVYSSNASDDVIDQHRNLKTHADQYLKLPLEPERLIAAIRPYLELQDPRAAAPARPAAPPPPPRQDPRPESRAQTRAQPGLEVQLSDAAPPQHDLGDEFNRLAGDLQVVDDDDHTSAPPRRASEPAQATPRPARPVSMPEPAAAATTAAATTAEADDSAGSGFKAQREALQFKGQLNAKNREILALKDDLEVKERAILDAKKHQRELQSQIGELESQVLTSQELILSSREAAEAAQRDKQTVLKREEGLKTRLEVTQKKLKDVEQLLTTTQQQLAATQQQASAVQGEQRQRIEVQSGLISDLEGERDGLVARVQSLDEQLAGMSESLEAVRDEAARLSGELDQTRLDASRALAAARQAQTVALGEQAAQYQSELDAQQQQHAAAVQGMQDQLDAQTEQAHEHAARQQQILADTEENARLQISQLSQTLAQTEENARAEIQRLTASLAAAEAAAHAEIQRLGQVIEHNAEQAQASADDAARKRRELELNIDELSNALDRAEALLLKRKQAAQHAQQALAVALRVLDDGSDAT